VGFAAVAAFTAVLLVTPAAGAAMSGLSGEATAAPGAAPGGGCSRPAQVLDLKNWKITLPVDDPDQSGRQPLEVTQPRLDGYAVPPWFTPTAACDGVQFRSAVNGLTTQNSTYPRSELREMTNNGTSPARWSSDSGTHTMVIDQAITHLPNDKPHVVVGQIHDANDDVSVFRLEGTKLYLTKGDTTHHKLITDNYVLGTRFQAKFEVSNGQVHAYYNGMLQATIPASFNGAYFKAGAYTQANCGNSAPCDSSNYGEVTIYQVTVTHS
jgi:Alginate lyase